MKYLLEDVVANTTGTQINVPFMPYSHNNGKGAVYASGTFDGCTITLEFSPDGGTTWVAVGTDTTFTAAGWKNFEIQGMVKLRASVTSAGASTEVSLGIL